MDRDTKNLFQITEAARACSLSRSTLLRLEERGLLTPAYTAPESGRRYYDNHNVARVMQIEKLKAMGLSSEEIADYFQRGGDVSTVLAALEKRLEVLRRGVEELRLRAAEGPGISVQMTALPAVTCCLRWCEGYTYEQRYAEMYSFYGACIRRGVRLSDEALFTISDRHDYLEGALRDEPYRFAVCVPVRPDAAPADAETLPPCRALSVLCCGGYGEIDEAWLTLGREVKSRALTPIAPPRVLGIVAPYTGREIDERRYCSRIVLPVEG